MSDFEHDDPEAFEELHEPPELSDHEELEEETGQELIPLGAVLGELDRITREAAHETAARLVPNVRTPPNAIDAERALLGGLLLEPSAMERVIDEGLRADDFYRKQHGIIFKAIAELHAAAEPVDTVTVVEQLMKKGLLEAVGGASAISQLEALIPTAAHVGAYARMVREKATLRQLIETATAVVESAFRQDKLVSEIIDEAERAILAIGESNQRRGIQGMDTLVKSVLEQLERAYRERRAITGVPTGFNDLDALTSGFQNGELIIVAARPSMGKCLAASSEIVLADGSVRTIEEIYRERAGRLFTLDEKLRLKLTSPSHFVDDGIKPTFRVTTRLGRTIETTITHPFLTVNGWRRLEELAVGERVAVPRKLDVFGTEAMRDCEVKLLGYLIGDGTLTGGTPRFTNRHPRVLEELSDAVAAFGGVRVSRSRADRRSPTLRISRAGASEGDRQRIGSEQKTRFRERGTTGRSLAAAYGVSTATATASLSVNGKALPDGDTLRKLAADFELPEPEEGTGARENPLTSWLKDLGLRGTGAATKHVPPPVFRLPREQLALFLNRLFTADGWATVLSSGQAQIGYASVSERLCRQVQHLLLRFGVLSSLRKRQVTYEGERRLAWQLDITDAESLKTFCEEIGIFAKEDAVEKVLRSLEGRRRQTNRDLIPVDVWDEIERAKGEESWASLARRAGFSSVSNIHAHRRALSRTRLAKIALALGHRGLLDLATSDVSWDEIVSIEPTGEQQVYDLTIPDTHNFIANDVCVHNTAITLNIAAHAAIRAQTPVAFFSLEMGAEQLVQRLIGAEARINIPQLRKGHIPSDAWVRLAQATGELGEAPIFIDETPGITVTEMRTKCRRLHHEHGLGLIIIDYLQLMTGPDGYDNKATEVGEISKGLKSLARELNVPVIALSQLNRGVESRTDKRPMMSDLRESGAIEQDADVIMFLYREQYYLKEKTPEDKLGVAEVIVAKHRNGPTGSVELLFFDSITRFENKVRDGDEYAP